MEMILKCRWCCSARECRRQMFVVGNHLFDIWVECFFCPSAILHNEQYLRLLVIFNMESLIYLISFSSSPLSISDFVFQQRTWPVIPWEISDVTTIAVFPFAGSVMAPMTVVMAQMRGTAVSVLCNTFKLKPITDWKESCIHQGYNTFALFFSLVLNPASRFCLGFAEVI